jgi:hypothetical protein
MREIQLHFYVSHGLLVIANKTKFNKIFTYLLTPWSRVHIEKITGFSQSKKLPHFMEPAPHSQVPSTCPYPEPDRSCTYTHISLPEDPNSSYPPIYAWVSHMVSFPQVSPPKPCINHTSYMPRPSHSSGFYHPNNIEWRIQIIKLFIM